MGIVYLARKGRRGQNVALKLLPPWATMGDAQTFLREISVQAQLDHPRIVMFLDSGLIENRPYLVTEYLPGGSLRALLASDDMLPLPQVVTVILQLAQALEFAHAHHVIHRDIKPENIYLDGHGNVKLGDFGLAKLVEGGSTLTIPGSVVGAPAYMAPEQFLGAKRLTPACDVYQLAVLAYELLTGYRPFEAQNYGLMMRKVLNENPPHPKELQPTLPEKACQVLMAGMSKDPAKRPGSAHIFAEYIASSLGVTPEPLPEGVPAGVGSVPMGTTTSRRTSLVLPTGIYSTQSRLRVALVLAVIALCGIVGAGLFYVPWTIENPTTITTTTTLTTTATDLRKLRDKVSSAQEGVRRMEMDPVLAADSERAKKLDTARDKVSDALIELASYYSDKERNRNEAKKAAEEAQTWSDSAKVRDFLESIRRKEIYEQKMAEGGTALRNYQLEVAIAAFREACNQTDIPEQKKKAEDGRGLAEKQFATVSKYREHILAGQTALQEQRFDDAIREFQEAIRLGNTSDALNGVQKAKDGQAKLELANKDQQYRRHMDAGKEALSKKDFEEAQDKFVKALAIDPRKEARDAVESVKNSAHAHYASLAQDCLIRNPPGLKEAAAYFEKALGFRSDNKDTIKALADVKGTLKAYEERVQAARTELDQGNFDKAIQEALTAQKIWNEPQAGDICAKANQKGFEKYTDEATASLNKSPLRRADISVAMEAFAKALAYKSDASAKDQLAQIKRNANAHDQNMAAGQALLAEKKFREAVQSFESALGSLPTAEAKEALSAAKEAGFAKYYDDAVEARRGAKLDEEEKSLAEALWFKADVAGSARMDAVRTSLKMYREYMASGRRTMGERYPEALKEVDKCKRATKFFADAYVIWNTREAEEEAKKAEATGYEAGHAEGHRLLEAAPSYPDLLGAVAAFEAAWNLRKDPHVKGELDKAKADLVEYRIQVAAAGTALQKEDLQSQKVALDHFNKAREKWRCQEVDEGIKSAQVGILVAEAKGLNGLGKWKDARAKVSAALSVEWRPDRKRALQDLGLEMCPGGFRWEKIEERSVSCVIAGGVQSKTTEYYQNSIGMEFVYIPPGNFMMGSPESEPGRQDNEPQHQVTLPFGFYMASTEVTQEQYRRIMGKISSGARPSDEVGIPVCGVSWNEAKAFCGGLSRQDGKPYDLPTEAQWEYACRAGTTTPFYTGQSISSRFARFRSKEEPVTASSASLRNSAGSVATLPANAWGLYDMSGNLWEWCRDAYQDRPSSSSVGNTPVSIEKVWRGGSWFNEAKFLRSAAREHNNQDSRSPWVGFRVVVEFGNKTKAPPDVASGVAGRK